MLSIYNKVSDYIMILNFEGEIIFCNKSFLKELEYVGEEIFNSNISKIIDKKSTNDILSMGEKNFQTIKFYTKTNKKIKISCNVSVENFNDKKIFLS
ncbi:PAS domain-containing protein [Terrisporobacter sp.]